MSFLSVIGETVVVVDLLLCHDPCGKLRKNRSLLPRYLSDYHVKEWLGTLNFFMTILNKSPLRIGNGTVTWGNRRPFRISGKESYYQNSCTLFYVS